MSGISFSLGGVLFCGGAHKGKALFRLLDEHGFQPKKVVFINDKATHIAKLEETCKKRGVPFVGLRYGYLDEKVEAFRPEVAEVQLQHFWKILSDAEAEKKLKDES